jgi:enterochelin esterase-like enzyme
MAVERRRLAVLAALSLAPLAACAPRPTREAAMIGADGAFETFELPSRHVAPRTITVWRPPGPADAPTAVLYLHDGQNLFAPANPFGNGPWDVDRHLVALQREGRVRRTLVVAIPNAGADRPREYFPQAAVARLAPAKLVDVLGAGSGAPAFLGDAHLRMLVEELKPAIDARYPTLRDRDSTFVGGSSMGALASLVALATHPRVFGGAAALSTHWPLTVNFDWLGPPTAPVVDDLADAFLAWLDAHLPRAGAHRLYLDRGTRTLDALYAPWQARADALLAAHGYRAGIDLLSRVFEGAAHDERAWRARLAEPLAFLLGSAQPDA